jgi:hypothetical protein
LRATAIEESLLQVLQATVVLQAFDGDDGCAARLEDGNQAAIDERAIDQNGAGAAFAFAAAFLRSGESELVAKNVEEALHRIRQQGFGLSVYGKRNFNFCARRRASSH